MGIYCLMISGKDRTEANFRNEVIKAGNRGFRLLLGLFYWFLLLLTWAISAAPVLSLFISQLSFPLLVSILLSSWRHGFLRWLFIWRRWPPNALSIWPLSIWCSGGKCFCPEYPHVDFRKDFAPTWFIAPLFRLSLCLVRWLWMTDSLIWVKRREHGLAKAEGDCC